MDDTQQAEQNLRRVFQELSFHMDNTPLAVLEWDHEFRLTRWTGQARKVFGWAAEEVLGKRAWEFRLIHDEDAASTMVSRNPKSDPELQSV